MLEWILRLGIVVTPTTLFVAVVAGFLVGYVVVGRVASTATYGPPSTVSAFELGLLTALMVVLVGAVFYVGQAVAAWADGDEFWVRVASRFGVWCAYAVALGCGVWGRLEQNRHRHRLRIHAKALREVNGHH